METFTKLFGSLLVFVYHCFDRIVIRGYLSGLSRPEQVVYFFREVVGAPVVDKQVLSQRTCDYQKWVEAYARNHEIPVEWAEKGVHNLDGSALMQKPLQASLIQPDGPDGRHQLPVGLPVGFDLAGIPFAGNQGRKRKLDLTHRAPPKEK